MKKNAQPKYLSRKVIDDTITARSIQELDEKLAALGITDDSKVGIRAEVRAIIPMETNLELDQS